ncbi:rRNA processing protein RRP7 [Phaffia rhodozyma]|uniref:rRNA processing protein RRP7 n=1 Tax=Phaffia rhodozyma TaxID=264483 RepID=A0A0F7SNH4_PHARH|nr:rRNA processing protein RRP7 [Phaffia rhodozyma]
MAKKTKSTESAPSTAPIPSSSSSTTTSKPSKKQAVLKIKDFTVLPIHYTTPSSSAPTTHYLYIRSDASTSTSSAGQIEEPRTLFVANLPPDSTEDNLRTFFGNCGPVENVKLGGQRKKSGQEGSDMEDNSDDDSEDDDMSEDEDMAAVEEDEAPRPVLKRNKKKDAHKKRGPPKISPLYAEDETPLLKLNRTSQSAKVLYLSPLSLARALLLPTAGPLSFPPKSNQPETDQPVGLSRYITSYALSRPSLAKIKAHADSSIAHFEYLKKQEVDRVTRMGEDIVDEDGFTLVVRGGKYGRNLAGGGVGVASRDWERNKEEIEGKKKKSKELKDFYRWQVREAKREDLAQLRSKFEADKEKIEKLKGSRRFKPY